MTSQGGVAVNATTQIALLLQDAATIVDTLNARGVNKQKEDSAAIGVDEELV